MVRECALPLAAACAGTGTPAAAHPAFSTAVLFRVTPSSAAEVHWRYEPAQCAMATGCADVPAPP